MRERQTEVDIYFDEKRQRSRQKQRDTKTGRHKREST